MDLPSAEADAGVNELIARDPSLYLSPRTLKRATPLRGTLGHRLAIIFPAKYPFYDELAMKLACAIEARCGSLPECVADTTIMPERCTPLPTAYRQRSLILLGSLNTNRALMPLYADYLCSTDATYPGGDGYELRTIVNPHGQGFNAILAGGSSEQGVGRAVGRLIAQVSVLPEPFTLPFLLEVDLDPALAVKLATWPQTPLEDTAELQANRTRGQMFYTEMIRIIGTYTLMWNWTADERYALVARDNLRALNYQVKDGYGDWHYLAERFMRAIPLLIAGGFLSDEEISRTDQLLLNTAIGTQDGWWRMRHAEPPLGHRHHGKGTYEFLLLARYLRDQTTPSPALRTLCDRWVAECQVFLDALAAAHIDDQDDESTLNNLATIFRYALGQERHAFFSSGNARRTAERALALHDNNGAGAGQGGNVEGLSGMMYFQQEATVPVAASAFYYGDGEMKWILEGMPNLSVAQRYGGLQYTPVFLQKFDTGPELKPVRPSQFLGVRCLPVTDHQYAINISPPVHIEFSGHTVNAPETWQMAEGVGLNRLPQGHGFDKIVFRGGFERSSAYLLLQGYQGGFRWQGHMQAANCIVRFFQAGHIFLIQNTMRHSPNDKNGLFISDGRNDTPMPPIAARLAVDDFAPIGMTATRLSDYHHADWTRHIFWSKTGAGWFVVIDHAVLRADGPASLTCTWRTPGYAELHGRRWHADQGDHRFTLVSGSEVPMTSEEESDQGASVPFVLRQRLSGEYRTGQEVSFQNLFYVRPIGDTEKLDLRRRDDRSVVLVTNGSATAWCGVAITSVSTWLPGATAVALSGWVGTQMLAFARCSALSLPMERLTITCDRPVGILVDLAAATLTLNLDSPDAANAKISVSTGQLLREFDLVDTHIVDLPKDACAQISQDVTTWLATTDSQVLAPFPRKAVHNEQGWSSEWRYDGGTRLPEKLRNLRVTANPLPVDGFPDQLIDAVLPESRETWRQWPNADHYEITITLPEPQPITSVSILGDCVDDPTLRTFCPLPKGIRMDAETADGKLQPCTFRPAPDRRYKRYRDAESRLQTRTAIVGCSARAFHLSISAPPRGGALVLHELEVYGGRTVIPAVTHWVAADVDGDGGLEIVIFNSANEILLIDGNGHELWRRQMPVALTHLSCQQLDSHGPPSICLGLIGGDIHILNRDGSTQKLLQVADDFRHFRDNLHGWYNSAHSIAVWHRDNNGRAALVVGGYSIMVFLNPDGHVVGHSWSEGPSITNILVAPDNSAEPGSIYARCGWNHGITQYKSFPDNGPSGDSLNFGGFIQPMFRMLRRVTPFINGRSLKFQWVDVPTNPDGAIFAAAELGCGLFSVRKGDWLWKREGGTSLQACTMGRVGGRQAVITGGADGFLTAISLEDGSVIRRAHLGSPVLGITQQPSSETVLAATREGVLSLDSEWTIQSSCTRTLRRMLELGHNQLLIERNDHGLELLHHNEPRNRSMLLPLSPR